MRILRGVLFAVCTLLFFAALGPSAGADPWDKKTIITFKEPVEVSGQVLQPGAYVFRLLDSSNDRHIVQIWNGNQTQLLDTIMTIPAYRNEPGDETILTFDERPSGSPQALRAWFYPGDNVGQEFVSPYSQ